MAGLAGRPPLPASTGCCSAGGEGGGQPAVPPDRRVLPTGKCEQCGFFSMHFSTLMNSLL